MSTRTAPVAMAPPQRMPHTLLAAIVTFWAVCLWSAWHPHDYFTWWLEVSPALAGFVALAWLYPRFRFTSLVYSLICAHAIVLFIGGHYTYAEVPLFNWVRDHIHLARNDYDRVGHFAQGFVPAFITREVFIRRKVVIGRNWQRLLIVCVALAISALYELFEWRVSIATGSAADAFLGSQGDPWDTQEDMATAFVAACIALLFGSLHERVIAREAPNLPGTL